MIYDIYAFLKGPMVWATFAVFIGGSIFRLISMGRLAKQKDAVIFNYISIYYALRSIVHWIVPFAGTNMRKHPVMTVVAFIFHIFLLAVPVFLSAHIILVKEAWNISWPWLPDSAADIMTMVVIGCCLFFLARRIMRREVRYLTSVSDVVILAAVSVPFISGWWAYHQWGYYPAAMIIHLLSGEILLMAIPFTKLSHMLFFPFTRGYMGSEFGAVRHTRDW